MSLCRAEEVRLHGSIDFDNPPLGLHVRSILREFNAGVYGTFPARNFVSMSQSPPVKRPLLCGYLIQGIHDPASGISGPPTIRFLGRGATSADFSMTIGGFRSSQSQTYWGLVRNKRTC